MNHTIQYADENGDAASVPAMEEGSEGTADSMPPLETVDNAAAANPNSQSDDGVQSESQKSPEEVSNEAQKVPESQNVPEDVPDEEVEEHLAADNMEAAEDEGNIDEEMQEDENVGVQEGDAHCDQGDQVEPEAHQGVQAAQDLEGTHGAQEVGEQDAASD